MRKEDDKMNQAILIMMHKEPEQVMRLIKYFPKDRCTCFIHIDKKADFDVAVFRERLEKQYRHCVILEKRISATLANWTLAQVSIELLKAAVTYEKEQGIHFSYYRLLSGQDYPIRSFQEYEAFLEKNYPQNYLGIDLIEDLKHIKDKFSRWRYWRIRNVIDCHVRNAQIRKIMLLPVFTWEIILTKVWGTPQKILERRGYRIAGGPSWWNLSHDFVHYFLSVVEKDKKLISVIQKTATPEESIIQTVYANSDFYRQGEVTWNLTIGKYKENGHTDFWEKEEVQVLLDSNCFFARKFTQSVSGELLDILDKKIF